MTYEQHLEIKTSQIPNSGLGVFAKCDIPKNAYISRFKGKIVRDLYNVPLPNIYYLVEMEDGSTIDVYNAKEKGKYINDAAGLIRVPGLKNNSVITYNNGKTYIMATRKIKKGEEIFVGYGSSYWKEICITDEQSASKHSS